MMRALAIAMALTILAAGSAPAQIGTVSPLISAGGEAPPPIVGEGAPNYSPEQTASAFCVAMDDGGDPIMLMVLARVHEATIAAQKARIDFKAGRTGEPEMRGAENARQKALGAGPSMRRLASLPRGLSTPLTIEAVSTERVVENGRRFLLVHGQVRNPSNQALEVPPLTMLSLDARDFVLAGQSSYAGVDRLAPGQVQAFTLRFRNPPQYTSRILARFAPPFEVRNFRGCGFLHPLAFDFQPGRGARLDLTRGEERRAGVDYTLRELAILARIAYDDTQAAYLAGRATGCAPLQPWPAMLAHTERAEEAWLASVAAEEVKRDAARGVFTAAEVEKAESDRQAAVAAFLAARPPPRPLKPPPVGSAMTETRRTWRGEDLILEGVIRNQGREVLTKPSVLLTVSDRYDRTISEVLMPAVDRVRTGGSAPFSLSVSLPRNLVGNISLKLGC